MVKRKLKNLRVENQKVQNIKVKNQKVKNQKVQNKEKNLVNVKKVARVEKQGELINEYDLVKIPGNDGSYELGIVLEKDSSDQYHNILFENGQTGEVKINILKLHKNQKIDFKVTQNVREKENEIENLIKAFNKVLSTHGDPEIPGTGSQSGEMIEKGVPFYENKIRFDVFAAAANGRPFREEIMNVISCCEEYQTLGECVHNKPKVNCSRNRTTPSPSSSSSSDDSE